MGSEIGREQLGAVLRCDMVGSTELLAVDGIDAAINARRRSTEIVSAACTLGQVLETRGDGMLVWFTSGSAAVAAGWRVQHEAGKVPDFDLRVAVSLHEAADGPGISAADAEVSQQLESACPPGSLVVDARTRRLISGIHGAVCWPLDNDVYQVHSFPTAWQPADGSHVEIGAVLFSDSTGDHGVAISRQCVAEHAGIVLDTNGAGHLATFSSCVQAVRAAQAMHLAAASNNLRADSAGSSSFRVGVSIGEVTVTADGEGFGLAVVEAARLLDGAEPNHTWLSSEVAELAGLDTSEFEHRGSIELKGLPHLVDVLIKAPEPLAPALLDLPLVLTYEERFPMIGRRAELTALEHRWSDVANAAGVSIVVSGEEGVGKTRLAREFAHQAHDSGAIVLCGSCDEGPGVPYFPVGAALAPAARLDATLQLASEGQGPLSMVVASGELPQMSASTDDGAHYESEDQTELFDEVANAIGRLAVVRPVVLMIDDIQWAEPDTLSLLAHIAAATSTSRVAVVATSRSEQLGVQAASALEPFCAAPRVEHLQLGRLSPAEVVALIESQTVQPLQGDEIGFASKIAEVTGGSPLYVEELLVHLVETEVVVRDDDAQRWSLTIDSDNVTVPASVLELVGRRVSRLGEPAVQLLTTAAMIGATFDIEVLADVAELSVDVVLDTIDDAEEAQILRSIDAGQSYRFADELSRSALLGNVRPSRRARVHQRIAESLERIHPNRIDQLAVHWTAAAGSEARAKAVHYLRRAGERDLAAAAWGSAAERQRAVLKILQSDGSQDIDLLAEVHLALGAALRLAGDEEHRQELMTAAGLARQARNGDRLFRCGAAMMRPGAWYPEAGVVDADIVAICEDSLLLLPDDDPLRVHVMAALATNLAYDHDHERRTKLVTDAQALAQASGDLHMIGSMYGAELRASHEPETFERRREIAEEVRRIGRATGDQALLITGSLFVVLDEISKGDAPIAASMLDDLTSLVEANGEYFTQYLAAYVHSALAVARCDDDMEDRIEQVRSRFENHPLDTFGMSLLQNGCIAMSRGTLSGLLLEIVKASTTWDEGWGAKWNYALSCAHLDAGDEAAALAVIEAKPFPDRDFYWLASMCQLAWLGMELKLTDLCERVVRELTPFRGRLALVGMGIAISHQVSTALGQAHQGLGEIEQAQALYRESLAQADVLGYPYFATLSRRHLAQALLVQDPHDDEAPELLSQVTSLAQSHGFADELRLATDLLRPVS